MPRIKTIPRIHHNCKHYNGSRMSKTCERCFALRWKRSLTNITLPLWEAKRGKK